MGNLYSIKTNPTVLIASISAKVVLLTHKPHKKRLSLLRRADRMAIFATSAEKTKLLLRDAILLMKRSLSLPPFNNGIFAGCWDPQISITETPTAKTTISLSFSPLETSFLVNFLLFSLLQFFMLVFSLFCNNFNINFYFLWLLLLLFWSDD